MVTMANDKDWNAALMGGEDWKAATGSEIFRNFVKITLAEEAKENQLKKEAEAIRVPEINSIEDFVSTIKKASSTEINAYTSFGVDFGNLFSDEEADGFQEKKEATSEDLELFTKQSSLDEAEQELGLNKNAFYLAVSRIK